MTAPSEVLQALQPDVQHDPEPESQHDPEPEREQPSEGEQPIDETVYLTGRPTLDRFLRLARREAIEPEDEASLIAEWQTANDLIQRLEREEAGLADNPTIGKLGPEYEPLLIDFLKDPLVRNGFNVVPTEVGFVELDRLVVYQKHIDVTHVRQIQKRLGPAPDWKTIFRTCLSRNHASPPVKWSRTHDDRFVFVSPSNDMRFLGTMPLESRHITNYAPPGALVAVIGLAVGFGTNFLNAIRAKDRIILNNGSHRAFALRDLGVTHVPCIIQHVSTPAELTRVASSAVRRHPDRYLKDPRPSLLKDYFDPKLRKVLLTHRRTRQITVKFEVDESFVPTL